MSLSPARQAYKERLAELQPMTDLAAAVAALTDDQRQTLAQGPKAYRYQCRVCEVLHDAAAPDDPDPDNPAWLVFGYHEHPKLEMRHRDDLHFGELANEVYRRCIAIYEAAGWTGTATEPDA